MHNVGTWNTAWLICKASAIKAELPEGARSIIFILLSYKCEFHTGTPQPGAQHTTLAQRLGGLLLGDLQTHLDVGLGQGEAGGPRGPFPAPPGWDFGTLLWPCCLSCSVSG